MSASTPMSILRLYRALADRKASDVPMDAPIRVYTPNGDFLGTVGEMSTHEGVVQLHTIKYEDTDR